MKRRVYDIVSLALLGITVFFLVLTVVFSTGTSVDFGGVSVTAVLALAGILMAASLVFARPSGNLPKRTGFYMTHGGIVLLLVGFALFEVAGDSVTAAVPVGGEAYYSNIQRENGEVCDLGFNFRVDSRTTEYYDDGSEKQHHAALSFADAVTLKVDTAELSVNHTLRRGGWKIYLMSYGYAADGIGEYVNLLFRYDPGEYIVKIGVAVLIAGTLLELLVGNAIRPKKEGEDHE